MGDVDNVDNNLIVDIGSGLTNGRRGGLSNLVYQFGTRAIHSSHFPRFQVGLSDYGFYHSQAGKKEKKQFQNPLSSSAFLFFLFMLCSLRPYEPGGVISLLSTVFPEIYSWLS